jgi:hypothetical protein
MDGVVRADALLGLECRKLLVIGQEAWLLGSEEHEYARFGERQPGHTPAGTCLPLFDEARALDERLTAMFDDRGRD